MRSDSSESELEDISHKKSSGVKSAAYRLGGVYYNKDEFLAMRGKTPSKRNCKSYKAMPKEPYYPNLSVLIRLIPLTAIRSYPKLLLVLHEALYPFREVFDN